MAIGWVDYSDKRGIFYAANPYPMDKWKEHFEESAVIVFQFLQYNPHYKVDTRQLPHQLSPQYALSKFVGMDGSMGKWEVVGVFDNAEELIVMIKLMM